MSAQNNRGFTLVELLVVIAIMAVMAVIGSSVYSGVQANARDAQRRSEITQIAKSIEASKNPITNTYTYTFSDLTKDFERSQRASPVDDGYGLVYCIKTSTAINLQNDATKNWTGATGTTCDPANNPSFGPINTSITQPAGDTSGLLYNGSGGTNSSTATQANWVKSWILCASMERMAKPFCVKSQQ